LSLERTRRAPGRSPATWPRPCGLLALIALAAFGCGAPTSGKSAAELYGEHCARCHGSDGRGDVRISALSPKVNLSRSALVAQRARGPIYLRITQGYGSMPAFSHKLERGDVDLLVDYVLELDAPSEAR